MFCAIATIIDRCKTEGVVDVFQVVKALRVQKPGAVPTLVSCFSQLAVLVSSLGHNHVNQFNILLSHRQTTGQYMMPP